MMVAVGQGGQPAVQQSIKRVTAGSANQPEMPDTLKTTMPEGRKGRPSLMAGR